MKPATAASAILALMLAAFPAQSEPTVDDEEDIEVVVDVVRFNFLENTTVIGLSIYTGRDQSSWFNPLSTPPPAVLYNQGHFVGSCSVEAGEPLCTTNPTNIPCPFPPGAQRYPATCSADLDLQPNSPSLLTDPRTSADEGALLSANIDVSLTPGDGVPRVFLTEFEGSQARQLKGKQLDDYLEAVGNCSMEVSAVTASCSVGPGTSPAICSANCTPWGCQTRREVWVGPSGRAICGTVP